MSSGLLSHLVVQQAQLAADLLWDKVPSCTNELACLRGWRCMSGWQQGHVAECETVSGVTASVVNLLQRAGRPRQQQVALHGYKPGPNIGRIRTGVTNSVASAMYSLIPSDRSHASPRTGCTSARQPRCAGHPKPRPRWWHRPCH